jgi:hypothetical protein
LTIASQILDFSERCIVLQLNKILIPDTAARGVPIG